MTQSSMTTESQRVQLIGLSSRRCWRSPFLAFWTGLHELGITRKYPLVAHVCRPFNTYTTLHHFAPHFHFYRYHSVTTTIAAFSCHFLLGLPAKSPAVGLTRSTA